MSLAALGTGSLNFYDGTAWQTIGPPSSNLFPSPAHSVNQAFTSGGTAHVKGAYVEIVASTSEETNLLLVDGYMFVSGAVTNWLVDVALGASGSEQNIVENLNCGYSGGSNPRFVPVHIPKGSRVSARVQSNRTNDTRTFVFQLFGGRTVSNTTVDVIGTSTATSGVTSTVTTNVWTEVVASTVQEYSALILCPGSNSGTLNNVAYNMWLGTGASGSEVAVASRVVHTGTIEIIVSGWSAIGRNVAGTISALGAIYEASVPAGTRLSIRVNSDGDRSGACIIGIPA